MSDRVLRYFGAVVLTLVGLALSIVALRDFKVPAGLLLAATVAVCARFLGAGPGLLAAALSALAIDFTMLPPIGELNLTRPETLAYLVVFAFLAAVISGATYSLHLARARALDIAARATRLRDVATALAEAAMPRDVASVAMDPGLEVAGATVGLIGAVQDSQFRILDWRPSSTPENSAVPKVEMNADGPLSEAMRTRRTVWVDSNEEFRDRYPAAYERFHTDLATAYMAMPLMHGDALIGGMLLGFPKPDSLGGEDHTFPHLLGQSVANALARARTLERERDGRYVAETTARAREEVLGVVAHDLRNPLGVAGSVMQMLSQFDMPPAQREKVLATGARAVNQMSRLIGDLLDVIRMEAGRLPLETEDCTAASLLDAAEEGARQPAEEKGLALTVDEPDPSLVVRADRGRLGQVLNNLLGNAIKFTPSGGRIGLRARRDGHEVVFEVSDTGPGVSPENQEHLFDRFWQARGSDRRGVGLGLAIARGIVEAHGGRIWVISKLGHGSRFFFALPAVPAATSSKRAS